MQVGTAGPGHSVNCGTERRAESAPPPLTRDITEDETLSLDVGNGRDRPAPAPRPRGPCLAFTLPFMRLARIIGLMALEKSLNLPSNLRLDGTEERREEERGMRSRLVGLKTGSSSSASDMASEAGPDELLEALDVRVGISASRMYFLLGGELERERQLRRTRRREVGNYVAGHKARLDDFHFRPEENGFEMTFSGPQSTGRVHSTSNDGFDRRHLRSLRRSD